MGQKELRDILDESPFFHLISLLCIPIEDAELMIITRILDGNNGLSSKKKDEALSRILCGRQDEEIQTLKKKFKKQTKKSLENEITSSKKVSAFTQYLSLCLQGDAMEEYDPTDK